MTEPTFDFTKAYIAGEVARDLHPLQPICDPKNRIFGRIIANGVDVITEAEEIVQTHINPNEEGEQ